MGFVSKIVALIVGGFLLLLGLGMYLVPTGDEAEGTIATVCGSIFLILGIIVIL